MSSPRIGDCYRAYKRWCIKLGIRPADFITWNQTTAKIKVPADGVRYDRGVSVLATPNEHS